MKISQSPQSLPPVQANTPPSSTPQATQLAPATPTPNGAPAEPVEISTDNQVDVQERASEGLNPSSVHFETSAQSTASDPAPIASVTRLTPETADASVEKAFLRARRSANLQLAAANIKEEPFALTDAHTTALGLALDLSDTAMVGLDSFPGQQALRSEIGHVVVLDTLFKQAAPEAYAALSSEDQGRLLSLMTRAEFRETLMPEIQGAGGAEASSGTESGVEGHYVNSPATSVVALLNSGRLDDQTLSALESLMSAELAPELADERPQLLSSVLQNIAFPEKIDQHSKGTCAATVPEMLFAQNNPADYVQTVTALASPGGQAQLGTGIELQREAGTEVLDDSGRSLASRLLQPALMEYANGDKIDYDNAPGQGQHSDGRAGLYANESTRILQATLGPDSVAETLSVAQGEGLTTVDRETLVSRVLGAVEQGQSVSVGVSWQDGGHKILVTGADDENVRFYNPWGELNTMPRSQFAERLSNASMPAEETWSLPAAAQNPDNYSEISPSRYYSAEDLETFQNDQMLREGIAERLEEIRSSEPEFYTELSSALPDLPQEQLKPLLAELVGFLNELSYEDMADPDLLASYRENMRALLP